MTQRRPNSHERLNSTTLQDAKHNGTNASNFDLGRAVVASSSQRNDLARAERQGRLGHRASEVSILSRAESDRLQGDLSGLEDKLRNWGPRRRMDSVSASSIADTDSMRRMFSLRQDSRSGKQSSYEGDVSGRRSDVSEARPLLEGSGETASLFGDSNRSRFGNGTDEFHLHNISKSIGSGLKQAEALEAKLRDQIHYHKYESPHFDAQRVDQMQRYLDTVVRTRQSLEDHQMRHEFRSNNTRAQTTWEYLRSKQSELAKKLRSSDGNGVVGKAFGYAWATVAAIYTPTHAPLRSLLRGKNPLKHPMDTVTGYISEQKRAAQVLVRAGSHLLGRALDPRLERAPDPEGRRLSETFWQGAKLERWNDNVQNESRALESISNVLDNMPEKKSLPDIRYRPNGVRFSECKGAPNALPDVSQAKSKGEAKAFKAAIKRQEERLWRSTSSSPSEIRDIVASLPYSRLKAWNRWTSLEDKARGRVPFGTPESQISLYESVRRSEASFANWSKEQFAVLRRAVDIEYKRRALVLDPSDRSDNEVFLRNHIGRYDHNELSRSQKYSLREMSAWRSNEYIREVFQEVSAEDTARLLLDHQGRGAFVEYDSKVRCRIDYQRIVDQFSQPYAEDVIDHVNDRVDGDLATKRDLVSYLNHGYVPWESDGYNEGNDLESYGDEKVPLSKQDYGYYGGKSDRPSEHGSDSKSGAELPKYEQDPKKDLVYRKYLETRGEAFRQEYEMPLDEDRRDGGSGRQGFDVWDDEASRRRPMRVWDTASSLSDVVGAGMGVLGAISL